LCIERHRDGDDAMRQVRRLAAALHFLALDTNVSSHSGTNPEFLHSLIHSFIDCQVERFLKEFQEDESSVEEEDAGAAGTARNSGITFETKSPRGTLRQGTISPELMKMKSSNGGSGSGSIGGAPTTPRAASINRPVGRSLALRAVSLEGIAQDEISTNKRKRGSRSSKKLSGGSLSMISELSEVKTDANGNAIVDSAASPPSSPTSAGAAAASVARSQSLAPVGLDGKVRTVVSIDYHSESFINFCGGRDQMEQDKNSYRSIWARMLSNCSTKHQAIGFPAAMRVSRGELNSFTRLMGFVGGAARVSELPEVCISYLILLALLSQLHVSEPVLLMYLCHSLIVI
jgi:hypothetical protein